MAQAAILTEQIAKERATAHTRTDFTANPKTMYAITEKPHQTAWTKDFARAQAESAANRKARLAAGPSAAQTTQAHVRAAAADPATAALLTSLRRADMPPQEKSEFPQTCNQEYGWHGGKPLVKPDNATHLWHKGLKMSEITNYVDSYVSTQGKSPFTIHAHAAASGTGTSAHP